MGLEVQGRGMKPLDGRGEAGAGASWRSRRMATWAPLSANGARNTLWRFVPPAKMKGYLGADEAGE